MLLIGHNPGLQRLALMLAASGAPEALSRLAVKFPTAAIAELAVGDQPWRALAAGTAELAFLWYPKDAEE